MLAIDAKATEQHSSQTRDRKIETHRYVAYLWIQDEVRSRRLQVRRVKSEDNIADLGTKPLIRAVIAKHCTTMGYVNMSQEDAQMGHQLWECFKTLNQCEAGDHVKRTSRIEQQQQMQQQPPQQQQQQEASPRASIFGEKRIPIEDDEDQRAGWGTRSSTIGRS